MRDKIAWAIANFALKYIATKKYGDMIAGSIRYGLSSAARDEIEKRESPFGWADMIAFGAEWGQQPPDFKTKVEGETTLYWTNSGWRSLAAMRGAARVRILLDGKLGKMTEPWIVRLAETGALR